MSNGSIKSIKIIPYAGLCNRMRAISSAIYVAKHFDKSIEIYWNKTHDCFSNFSDLFELPLLNGVCVRENRNPLYMINGPRSLFIPKWLRSICFDTVISDYSANTSGCLSSNGVLKGDVIIESCCDLDIHYDLSEVFRPTKEIQLKIDKIVGHSTNNQIGIHIRRTDNAQSIQSASVDDFLMRMESELNLSPDVYFYLATDDKDAKERLRETFGDKVIAPDLCLSRSSTLGMKDAVVDLYCLSKSKKIIGSFYSSYSEIAAEIGGIELEICKCEN